MRRYYVGGEYDEILGDDEILGYDAFGAEDFFGGEAPDKVGRLARVRAAGGVEVAQVQPSQMRRQVLPFRQSFALSTTATITLQPQRKFRPERLSFASATAAFFTITDVSIAQEPQFVAPGTLSAQLFTEVSVGMELRAKTANLGSIISITATNQDAANTQILAGQITGVVVM
jgi:hypothetical protein